MRHPDLPTPPPGVKELQWAFMIFGPAICNVCLCDCAQPSILLTSWNRCAGNMVPKFILVFRNGSVNPAWSASFDGLAPADAYCIGYQEAQTLPHWEFRGESKTQIPSNHVIWRLIPYTVRYGE